MRTFLKVVVFSFVALLSISNVYALSVDNLKKELEANIVDSLKAKGADVNVKVEVIKKLENPKGFYFVKVTFYEKKKPDVVAGEQYLFTDGNFIVQDFLTAKSMSSLSKELLFEVSTVKVDTTGLTAIIGKPGAKNVIIDVTDFQCPYCVKANEYIHSKLKNLKDTVVYVMHFPLRSIHPTAEHLAKIFEAGMMMGKNFVTDLYDEENGKLSEADLTEKYAKKSGNPKKFKELVASKDVADKVSNSEAKAKAIGINSTPAFIINGKMVSGFDTELMDKAIKEFK